MCASNRRQKETSQQREVSSLFGLVLQRRFNGLFQ
jgi:hypothetical protein